ncbi:MAG: ribosome-associated translation inhibitor RaiA [Lentisphaerae bacterium]|nr:ribosome-associated translation inhibitor RaiA [Lentisphaerota bacterium]
MCGTLALSGISNLVTGWKNRSETIFQKGETMQIIVNGRHFQVTDLIRSNTEAKIEALFNYYPTLKVSSVRVTMEIEKNHQAKVGICAAVKKQQMVAEGAALDLYKAIDEAVDHLKVQLDKYVDKYKHPAEATPPARDLSAEAV